MYIHVPWCACIAPRGTHSLYYHQQQVVCKMGSRIQDPIIIIMMRWYEQRIGVETESMSTSARGNTHVLVVVHSIHVCSCMYYSMVCRYYHQQRRRCSALFSLLVLAHEVLLLTSELLVQRVSTPPTSSSVYSKYQYQYQEVACILLVVPCSALHKQRYCYSLYQQREYSMMVRSWCVSTHADMMRPCTLPHLVLALHDAHDVQVHSLLLLVLMCTRRGWRRVLLVYHHDTLPLHHEERMADAITSYSMSKGSDSTS